MSSPRQLNPVLNHEGNIPEKLSFSSGNSERVISVKPISTRIILPAVVFLFLLASSPCCSQYYPTDSVNYIPSKAQKWDTFKKSLWAPAAMIGVGTLVLSANDDWRTDEGVQDFRNRLFPDFRTRVDDYLIVAPVAAVYGMNAFGLKGKHNFYDRTAILLKAELMGLAIVAPVKMLSDRQRPNGTTYDSFPSGHTAKAFISATFMHREYGHLSPWYSIGGYAVAASVGALRILNNKHYLSDVLYGGAVGILVTNLAYATHGYKRTKKKMQNLQWVPTYTDGTVGLYTSFSF